MRSVYGEEIRKEKKKRRDAPLQLPSPGSKNPSAHAEHFVPLLESTYPALHVHPPLASHTPFMQLQFAGAVVVFCLRQTPEPAIPSSHCAQLDEQGVQLGPKWDAAQASHDEPVKPALHAQVPAEVQVPPVSEQGVEQEVLWRETRERRPLMLEEDGS